MGLSWRQGKPRLQGVARSKYDSPGRFDKHGKCSIISHRIGQNKRRQRVLEHPLAANPQDCTSSPQDWRYCTIKAPRRLLLHVLTWDRVAVFGSTLSASGMHGRAYVASNGGALSYVFSTRTHQRRVEHERL